MTNSMQELWGSSHLSAGHSAYLETLYEKYLNKPEELSEEWLEFFNNLPNSSNGHVEISHQSILDEFKNLSRASISSNVSSDERQGKVIRLIQAYRNRGHQEANLDPLGIMERDLIEDLKIESYGLSESDLDDEFYTDTFSAGSKKSSLRNIIEELRRIYCGNIGIEYNYIMHSDERRWFQKQFESKIDNYSFSNEEKIHIFERLN